MGNNREYELSNEYTKTMRFCETKGIQWRLAPSRWHPKFDEFR